MIISEIQVGGDVAGDEFVELYNPTNNPVVMENWRLTRMTSTGTEHNLVSDIDATIPAHSYFLIAPAEYDGTVTPDFAYSTSQRIAANNSVALYSHSLVNEENVYTRVDLVGMGTATVVETAAVANPEANGSVRRVNDDDTDNNSVDFAVLSVSDPQNSTVSVTPSPTATSTPTPTPAVSPTATATATPTMSPTPTSSSDVSPTPTMTPSPSPTSSAVPSATPRSIATFNFPNMVCKMEVRYVRFGFWRMPFVMMVCERN